MITTSMLKQQMFDHIPENSQRVLRLNAQYEYHPYAEEFTKECNVMFIYETYVLEGEADAEFSLSDIWNLLHSANNSSNFYRQMINCMRAWNYAQKTGFPLNTEIIKQKQEKMMDKEKHQDRKDVLVGESRKSHVFADFHIFAPAVHIERHMEGTIFRFHETKKDDPIMAATNLFGNIINMDPFEDENGRICHLILAHVLMQMMQLSISSNFKLLS